jgi:hypothetical protein
LLNIVVKEYPKSHKFEPATNRLALIKQKKIEGALLDILKTVPSSGSSAPASSAAGTSQQKTTEEAILEYQRRIAPYLINEAYKEQNPVPAAPPQVTSPSVPQQGAAKTDTIMRLLSIKTTALEIMDRLVSALNTYEIIEDTARW